MDIDELILRWMLEFGDDWVPRDTRKAHDWYWNEGGTTTVRLNPWIIQKELPEAKFMDTRIRLSQQALERIKELP